MSKTIEPPVLISRVLAFVLATSVVVVLALVLTLTQMVPLERPEIFFLFTQTIPSNVVIMPMNPDSANQKTVINYKKGFIREYIIARNELKSGSETILTRENWETIVKPWSSPKVFSDLQNTTLYKRYTFGAVPPMLSCDVNFSNINDERAILQLDDEGNEYSVNFVWICKNISGHIPPKNYKIRIRIQSELDKKVSGLVNNLEKLQNNPLGIRVVEYDIEEGETDPLNSDNI